MGERSISEDVLKYLCNVYFQENECMILRASKRAYLDLCRTIDFEKDITDKKKKCLVNEVGNYFKEELDNKEGLNKVKNGYDEWHDEACSKVMKKYNGYVENCNGLYYGQAQKWVNMTMKYLYILNKCYGENQEKYDFLEKVDHLPIDSIILQKLNGNEKKIWNNKTWSKFGQVDYATCKKEIKEKLAGKEFLFMWELRNWKENGTKLY